MGAIFSKSQDELDEALLETVKSGDTSEMQNLLESGADVNRKFRRESSNTGHISHIQERLEAGETVNDGLMLYKYKHIEKLIKPELLLFSLSLKGYTPLMMAATTEHVNSVKMLLDSGADVNQTNERGETAIFYAVRTGAYSNLKLLIAAGADANHTNNKGCAPLQAAVTCNTFRIPCSHQLQCIQLILKAGAHVNKWDREGNDALSNFLYDMRAGRLYVDHPMCNSYKAYLLYGAGEPGRQFEVEECLQESEGGGICPLKHLSRVAIRTHMLNLDPHSNLFGRYPKLGLPSVLTRYLLFGTSLDDEEGCPNHGS